MRDFKCEACGILFVSERPEGESEEEYFRNFGHYPNPEDDAIICDGCYQRALAMGLFVER